MLNKENIRKWVDALRSGKYPQTTGALKNDWGYCCLGVACEISNVGKWKPSQDKTTTFYATTPNEPANSAILPLEVQQWLGINSMNPLVEFTPYIDDVYDYERGQDQYSLTQLNDRFRKSFNEIADAIEATYLEGE